MSTDEIVQQTQHIKCDSYFCICWCEIYGNGSKKAHLDCTQEADKVIDGAKIKWLPILLLDAIMFAALGKGKPNNLKTKSRRAFNQHDALRNSVMACYTKGSSNNPHEHGQCKVLYDTQEWQSFERLSNFMMESQPTKSKLKFARIVKDLMKLRLCFKASSSHKIDLEMIIHKVVSDILQEAHPSVKQTFTWSIGIQITSSTSNQEKVEEDNDYDAIEDFDDCYNNAPATIECDRSASVSADCDLYIDTDMQYMLSENDSSCSSSASSSSSSAYSPSFCSLPCDAISSEDSNCDDLAQFKKHVRGQGHQQGLAMISYKQDDDSTPVFEHKPSTKFPADDEMDFNLALFDRPIADFTPRMKVELDRFFAPRPHSAGVSKRSRIDESRDRFSKFGK